MSDIETLAVELGASDVLIDKAALIAMATTIVSAYVANNSVPASELPSFVQLIYRKLGAIGGLQRLPDEVCKASAGTIRKSITRDHIVCLEDGKKFQTMKRHLASKYNLTPDQYRAKWGLPKDYPMVAPAYSEARSTLAKAVGLGIQRGVTAVRKPSKVKAT